MIDLIKRYESLKARGAWEETWQEISDYVLPRKSDVTVLRAKGEKKTTKLFDSTAIHANELLAASLQGTLTSSSAIWFGLRTRQEQFNEDKEVKLWLADSANKMYRAFNASNFNSEIHEVYLDLGSVGTPCLLEEERSIESAGFNGFHFKSFFIADVYIDENEEGVVDTVFRNVKFTARQAFLKWGEDIGPELMKIYRSKPDEDVEILHAVFPSKEGGTSTKLPYASIYYDVKYKHRISEGGYHEFPYMVPRWNKSSGEKYGRSPSFTALPDVRTLNRAVELELKAWAKDIDPAMLVPDEGISGNFKLISGALNFVRPDLIDKIKPIESGHRYDVSQLKLEELRSSIKSMYFSDQLQFQDTPTMTATEVQIRFELMQRLLGPTLGRLESELLAPLITRSFNIMLRARAFKEPPSVLQGEDIDIEYVGPLARAQRFGEVTAINNWLQMITPLAEVKQDILDNVDFDAIASESAELLSVPPKVVKSKADVKKVRDARADAQENELEKQDAAAAGETIAALAKAV